MYHTHENTAWLTCRSPRSGMCAPMPVKHSKVVRMRVLYNPKVEFVRAGRTMSRTVQSKRPPCVTVLTDI